MAWKNKKKIPPKASVLVGDSSEPGILANPLNIKNVSTILGGVLSPLLQNIEFEGKLSKQLLFGSVTQEMALQVLDKILELVPEKKTCHAIQVLDKKSEPVSALPKSAKVLSVAE